MAQSAKAGAKKPNEDRPRVVAAPTGEQKPLPLGPNARTNARFILVALVLWTASRFLPSLIVAYLGQYPGSRAMATVSEVR
jgi:hypothetical protein